ncbi:MAG: PAS domain-containing protein [Deltaproteobacteria bacterium]|nr:PAS domain-containing protein [Deltaproteobacteria bacterium]
MVIDTMMEGLVVVDMTGTILSVNQAMENLTGYSRQELVGRSCAVIRSDSCFDPQLTEKGKYCALFQCGQLKRAKCALVKKDGSLLHVLKNAALLRDEQGNVVGGVETFVDISEVVAQERVIFRLRRELTREDSFQGILGKSPAMQQLFTLVSSAAQSEAPVVIYGESGTGKELVAAAIHKLSPRSNGPFIKVNSAALNESLLESELFGHVKGAFTGADRTRIGRFEAANGGDIFLDEIGDMPLATQAKLLRVLQEKVIEKVGDLRSIPVEVRVISATNKNLGTLMADGRFREDLYYRIGVIPIHLPPLRQRPEDIPLLVETFIERARLKTKKLIQGISKAALDFLLHYQWPGNIRELINVIDYTFVVCPEGIILPEHLPVSITQKPLAGPNTAPPRPKTGERAIPKEAVLQAMHTAQGKKSEAARLLGISRVTLWKYLKEHNTH